MENTEEKKLNSEKIGKIWKKPKLNSEKIWKIQKKGKKKRHKVAKYGVFIYIGLYNLLFICFGLGLL